MSQILLCTSQDQILFSLLLQGILSDQIAATAIGSTLAPPSQPVDMPLIVKKYLAVVSKFWADNGKADEISEFDALQHQDSIDKDNDFTVVLSKCQKKKNNNKGKAATKNTRSRTGPRNLAYESFFFLEC